MSRGCLGLLALLASLGRADPTWRPLPFPLAPAPRWVHAMAWDPLRERVIVFGGVTWGAGGRLERDHFWAWDGASWRFLPASPGPALRLAALAFEPARGRAVVYGLGEGYDAVETWVWDGTRWERRFPQAQPPRLCGIGMVHDEARARSVLVGYDCFQNTSTNAHTWVPNRQLARAARKIPAYRRRCAAV